MIIHFSWNNVTSSVLHVLSLLPCMKTDRASSLHRCVSCYWWIQRECWQTEISMYSGGLRQTICIGCPAIQVIVLFDLVFQEYTVKLFFLLLIIMVSSHISCWFSLLPCQSFSREPIASFHLPFSPLPVTLLHILLYYVQSFLYS